MKNRYQAIMSEIGALNTAVKEVFDKAGDEELDKTTFQTVVTNNKKIEELELEAKELLDQQAARDAATRRDGQLKQPMNRPGLAGNAPSDDPRAAKSIGEQLIGNKEFADWIARIAPNGRIPEKTRVESPGFAVKNLITGTSNSSAGALVVNDRTTIVDPGTFRRPLTVLDLITRGSTGSDVVEWVQEGAHVNNAAPVAEATAVNDGSGSKPQSTMTLAIVQSMVKTIAHWIPVTRRALADAAQLRTFIDAFLIYGLQDTLEAQILTGNGAGENFTGIFNTSGTSTQTYDTSLLVTARKGRTKVQVQGKALPTAYLFNPLDWEAFDLLLDGENRFYFGGPSVLGQPRLWGLPVVESERVPQGEGLVADFRLAALWDAMQAQIMMSDSHSDFFTRNLIALLAELRAAFGVIRPAAFCELDLTP